MKFEMHDIITLGNNKSYTISEILDYSENKYLYLIEVDENEELLEETRIVKVIADTNGNYGVEDIENVQELKDIQEIFIELIESDYI